MRVNKQQMVFNVLNTFKYPGKDITKCSLIFS